MNDKTQLVKMLQAEINRWDTLLSSLSEEQMEIPLTPSDLSVKDTLAHLMAWQQRSNARMEAGLANKPPVFPEWAPGLDPDLMENTDQINAAIFKTYHDRTAAEVHRLWRDGFLKLITLVQETPDEVLFAVNKFDWLAGYRLADVPQWSYEHHHQEHLNDSVLPWLREHGNAALADTVAP